MPGPAETRRDRPLEEILVATRATVVSHPMFDEARRSLEKFVSSPSGAACIVTGPNGAGTSTLARAVFDPRDDALVVTAPAGPLAGRGFRATRLLEAILRTGEAPMVDGLVSQQLPLTTTDGRILVIMPDPARQGGRDAAEATLVRAVGQMKKHRGIEFLVLDQADSLLGLASVEHFDWILRVATEARLRLVLVVSDHVAATVLEKLAWATKWHTVALRRYRDFLDANAVRGFRDALEELQATALEVRFPELGSNAFYFVSCYSLGCFGLACQFMETLIGRALSKRGSARGTLTIKDMRLDPDDEERLHTMLTVIEEGEARLRDVMRAGRDGRSLPQRLGLARGARRRPPPRGNGIHRPRVGDPKLDRVGEAQIEELGF